MTIPFSQLNTPRPFQDGFIPEAEYAERGKDGKRYEVFSLTSNGIRDFEANLNAISTFIPQIEHADNPVMNAARRLNPAAGWTSGSTLETLPLCEKKSVSKWPVITKELRKEQENDIAQLKTEINQLENEIIQIKINAQRKKDEILDRMRALHSK